MNPRLYWLLPSAGLAFLLVSLGGALGFAAWGLAEPPLALAWELQGQLHSGLRDRITGHERRILERVFAQAPDFTQETMGGADVALLTPHVGNRLDGKSAYLLVASKGPLKLSLRCRDCGPDETVRVRSLVGARTQRLTLQAESAASVELPHGDIPRIVELRFGKANRQGSNKTRRRALEFTLEAVP